MTIKFSGTIDVRQLMSQVFRFLTRTYASRLFLAGVGLLSINSANVVLYAIQTVVLKQDHVVPPGSFGTLEVIGLCFVIIGGAIAFYHWASNERKSIEAERTNFKETFGGLSDARLQDELYRLYKIRGADVHSIRAILSHPSNVGRALDLYQLCYRNVVYEGPWFSLRGRFFKARYNIGFLILVLVILHALACSLLAVVEFYKPGILSYGPHAAYYLLGISALVATTACQIFSDLRKMGTAITLVEKSHPRAI